MKSEKHETGKDSSENETVTPQQQASQPAHPPGAKPEWANGLRQLYDSVVEEPLPDSFKDLLAQLDDEGK